MTTSVATLDELTDLRSPAERIAVLRSGIPRATRKKLASALGWSLVHLEEVLGIKPGADQLAPSVSERFLLLHDLLLQVQTMLDRSGTGEPFDAGRWLGRWLDEPNPALGGKPAAWLDTCVGFSLVAGVLASMETGAYR